MPAPLRRILLVPGLLLLACQGGSGEPSGLDRDIDPAAPSACRNNGTFGQAAKVYTSNSIRNDKLSQCKDIESFVKSDDAEAAEAGINVLLAALSDDVQSCLGGGVCILADPVASGAATFADASCDLANALDPPLAADECLRPSAARITAGQWVVEGPLQEDDEVVLPNDSFAVRILDLAGDFESSGIFVAILKNEPTPALGPCPDPFVNDCEQQNYAIDSDPDGAFATDGLYVEACESEDFVTTLASCDGTTCAPGNSAEDQEEILTCTVRGKFSATSDFVGADDAERVRDVLCDVRSRSAGVSTGTLCQLFSDTEGDGDADGAAIGSCVTEATGQKSGDCEIDPAPPVPGDDTCFVLFGEKVSGTGSHRGQTAFCMSPDDPERGVTEEVIVRVLPQ